MSQKVLRGCEDDYRRWQDGVNRAAGGFAGFEGTESYPPESGASNEGVVVFRFSRVDQLSAWLRSSTCRRLIEEGRGLFEEAAAQEVLSGGSPVKGAVTAVVSHEVWEGGRGFLRWQHKTLKAQEGFPGFMGTELFEPVEGIQDRWVVIFRFDTREHLGLWLESDVRQRLTLMGCVLLVAMFALVT
jgi:antibiotic biosynthesis monooxygenase (ABM) superfamily enzyme